MNAAVSPLDRLPSILGGPKGRLARRLVWQGAVLDAREFASRGLALGATERAAIDAWIAEGLESRVTCESHAADGTVRFVSKLADGESIETVAMPTGTACLSSQVGCAVACRFCASGRDGVKRNLTASEILEQLVHARRRMPVRRVVFMGMGEPIHNLENVLDAVARLRDDGGIGAANQVVSTVGSIAAIDRLAAASVRPCLALSLHSAHDEKRAALLPHAPREKIRDLVARADAYGRETGRPIQIEWTLLAGVNDGDDEWSALPDLLRGARACLNFIIYNPVDGFEFRGVGADEARAIAARLRGDGLFVTVRRSLGADADAACGQLRRRRASESEPSGVPRESGM